jgi:hypothetical protein
LTYKNIINVLLKRSDYIIAESNNIVFKKILRRREGAEQKEKFQQEFILVFLNTMLLLSASVLEIPIISLDPTS